MFDGSPRAREECSSVCWLAVCCTMSRLMTFQVANALMKGHLSRGTVCTLLQSDTNTGDRHARRSHSAQWSSCRQCCSSKAVDTAPQPHSVTLAVCCDACLEAESDRLLQPRRAREHLSSQCMPPAALARLAPRLPANTRRGEVCTYVRRWHLGSKLTRPSAVPAGIAASDLRRHSATATR